MRTRTVRHVIGYPPNMSWFLTFVLVSSVAGCILGLSYRLRFQGSNNRHRPPNYCWARRRLDLWANIGSLCAFADLLVYVWLVDGHCLVVAILDSRNHGAASRRATISESCSYVNGCRLARGVSAGAPAKGCSTVTYAKQLDADPEECL